ncbi:hypothetical protein DPMN_164073 [Dreissena polymorpha]|uniref:Uncharacterized protein n=1 Tax=Dreissena polymorpha TaxID=45954 RepID=A0A9D4IV83_DREPO|nr:hypothetical protein DPMN_164073 [Dreissena polymorpha]
MADSIVYHGRFMAFAMADSIVYHGRFMTYTMADSIVYHGRFKAYTLADSIVYHGRFMAYTMADSIVYHGRFMAYAMADSIVYHGRFMAYTTADSIVYHGRFMAHTMADSIVYHGRFMAYAMADSWVGKSTRTESRVSSIDLFAFQSRCEAVGSAAEPVRASTSGSETAAMRESQLCLTSRVKAQSHYDAGGAPSPGRTGNDRGCTRNNRDGTGNNRDGTVAPPRPIQTPAELQQRPGGAPVNAVKVPVKLRGALSGRCPLLPGLNRDTTGDNRGYADMLPAFTGAQPGHYRGFARASPG